jgi:hypothetical protein
MAGSQIATGAPHTWLLTFRALDPYDGNRNEVELMTKGNKLSSTFLKGRGRSNPPKLPDKALLI